MNQQGKVIACDADSVWLDVSRQSVCQSCEAKNGCGKQLVDKAGFGASHVLKLPKPQGSYNVGETVELALPDADIARASLLLYVLPLLSMLAFGAVANTLGSLEPVVILSSLTGLAIGLLGMRVIDSWQGKRLAKHLLIKR